MTTQRPTFTQRGGDGAGFFYLLASGGASGSINFDFTTGSLPAGITFTRASIGTYNSSGNILTTASNDVARFNYISGVANLLIEPSATNMLTQSNNFGDAAWTGSNATRTAAQFISPDGANNGWSLTNSAAAKGGVLQSPTVANIPYTMSCWAKLITGSGGFFFQIGGKAGAPVLTSSATLTRFSTTQTPNAGSGASVFWNNDTTLGNANGIYGMQLETGSVPTSYIPTTTAAVTRAADSAVFTIPAGINQLVYTFDDNSTQTVAVSPGSYTIPTTLNRPNIKSVVGRYAFDFTSGSLPAGMTFTRPSIGTYVNASGTLITAGNDVARFNYVSGVANLLIEGSATNLLKQSNNFLDGPSWLSTSSGSPNPTAAQFISPDGANNGWSISSGTGNGFVGQDLTFSNIPYAMSIWAKSIIGTSPISLWIADKQSAATLPISSTIARISYIQTPTAGASSVLIQIQDVTGKTDGIYGAQLETGSKMTSYIPTTTAAVTRAADSAVFTIPAGINQLVYTFDDNSTQLVTVSAGSYTIPVTLNRPNIKSIVGSA